MKFYAYCLTINNPSDSDFLLRRSEESTSPYGWVDPADAQYTGKRDLHRTYPLLKKYGIDYLLIGTEYGKKGTKHYQMVVVFNVQKTLGQVKKIWPRAHIEYMKGTLKEAAKYITNNSDKPNPKYSRAYIGKIEDIERRIQMDKEMLKIVEDSTKTLADQSARIKRIEESMDAILGLLKEQHTSI
jgi:hypothetical protein